MEMTTRQEISDWFDRGAAQGSQQMVIVCDTYDWDDYPVFCSSADEARRRVKYPGDMQKVMEVYDLTAPKDAQLNQHRVMKFSDGNPL